MRDRSEEPRFFSRTVKATTASRLSAERMEFTKGGLVSLSIASSSLPGAPGSNARFRRTSPSAILKGTCTLLGDTTRSVSGQASNLLVKESIALISAGPMGLEDSSNTRAVRSSRPKLSR